jgi:Tfp pilus assembly PilM family ATPase
VSRSWTSYFSSAPKVRAGIALGRSQISAVLLAAQANALDVRSLVRHELPLPLFAGQPTAEAEAGLADALNAVSGEFRAKYAAVHIALPDTVIRSTVFELDELPKPSALREALLRWRFAGEWQRPEDSLECRGQDLGQDSGKRLFLGQAADRPWVECVRRALAQAGITSWSLNAASGYRFNRFHDAIADEGGALVSLDPDCWNLLVWDGAGRVRRVLTRLRDGRAAQEEMQSIADEAGRAVLAYVEKSGGGVGRVYLAGSDSEMAALAGVFDERMHTKALHLHADEGVSGAVAGIRTGLAPLALAAALNV